MLHRAKIPLTVGIVFMLLLHLYFFVMWDFLYAKHPWPGYQKAMSEGLIDPHFNNSPRALLETAIALLVLGLVVAWAFRWDIFATAMCGIGLVVTAIVLALGFRGVRESNLLPPSLVALGVAILVTFLVGVALGRTMKWAGHAMRGLLSGEPRHMRRE